MKIAHFSDPHAGGPAEDWLAYVDKRWVGVFNYYFRRRFQHDLSLLELGVNRILEMKPDLAVCTGDLTSTGQPGEFQSCLDILKKLRDSSIPLLYVPGNHDCYVPRPRCVAAMKDAFKYLNTAFDLCFDDLPAARPFNGCEIIIINESGPTNLISSHGVLNGATERFVASICAEEKQHGPRVLVAHYPLIEEHPIARWRHRLYGQRNVARLLDQGKIDLSLCGHIHAPFAKLDDRGRGETSAGSITRNACMSEIEYDADADVFKHEQIILDS